MVYFQTKFSDLGKFWKPWNGKCWYILWPFGKCYGHLVYFRAIWQVIGNCLNIGILYHEKSGNPGDGLNLVALWVLLIISPFVLFRTEPVSCLDLLCLYAAQTPRLWTKWEWEGERDNSDCVRDVIVQWGERVRERKGERGRERWDRRRHARGLS
jgi:hypothetical protein